jgi:hypothetical protein
VKEHSFVGEGLLGDRLRALTNLYFIFLSLDKTDGEVVFNNENFRKMAATGLEHKQSSA